MNGYLYSTSFGETTFYGDLGLADRSYSEIVNTIWEQHSEVPRIVRVKKYMMTPGWWIVSWDSCGIGKAHLFIEHEYRGIRPQISFDSVNTFPGYTNTEESGYTNTKEYGAPDFATLEKPELWCRCKDLPAGGRYSSKKERKRLRDFTQKDQVIPADRFKEGVYEFYLRVATENGIPEDVLEELQDHKVQCRVNRIKKMVAASQR